MNGTRNKHRSRSEDFSVCKGRIDRLTGAKADAGLPLTSLTRSRTREDRASGTRREGTAAFGRSVCAARRSIACPSAGLRHQKPPSRLPPPTTGFPDKLGRRATPNTRGNDRTTPVRVLHPSLVPLLSGLLLVERGWHSGAVAAAPL